jgi:hypothetical protein
MSGGSVTDSPWVQSQDCQFAPASFAKSLDKMDCFEPLWDLGAKAEKNMVILPVPVEGATADFLYVRLDLPQDQEALLWKKEGDGQNDREKRLAECKVLVRFPTALSGTKTAAITCNYADGELLLPIGINAAWFLEKHSAIEFVIETELGEICPRIQEMQFYHLRD